MGSAARGAGGFRPPRAGRGWPAAIAVALVLCGCAASPIVPEDAARFPVRIDGRYGFIDGRGRLAIAPAWRNAGAFRGGLAPVQSPDTERWGYVDAAGALRIPAQFLAAEPFREGVAAVRTERGVGYLRPDGTWAIAARFAGGDLRLRRPARRVGSRAGLRRCRRVRRGRGARPQDG